jgi:uncharacterized glyoxalase superfamily protein PhnB
MSAPIRVTFSVATHDLKRAFDFYRKGLGLRLATEAREGEMPEPVEFSLDARTHLMVVPVGGLKRVLGERTVVASPDLSECVIGLSFESRAEVDTWLERACAAGATIESPAQPLPWGYSANLRDPDGHLWMLVASSS